MHVTEQEEPLLGIACVTVPVFDSTGTAVGAISLSGRPYLLKKSNLAEIVPELMETGTELSRRLGYIPEVLLR